VGGKEEVTELKRSGSRSVKEKRKGMRLVGEKWEMGDAFIKAI
jgi:hypothetical protein